MNEEILKNIESKLDMIIMLMVRNEVRDMKKSEAAPFLRELGLMTKQIADILGSTEGAVRKYVSDAKKKD